MMQAITELSSVVGGLRSALASLNMAELSKVIEELNVSSTRLDVQPAAVPQPHPFASPEAMRVFQDFTQVLQNLNAAANQLLAAAQEQKAHAGNGKSAHSSEQLHTERAVKKDSWLRRFRARLPRLGRK
jgi:hypothetical protein